MACNVSLIYACLLLITLACGESLGATKDLISPTDNVITTSYAVANGGTCKSRVEIFGYKCEEHTVTTRDGYIISLQRIPSGRSVSHPRASERKQPVLLQHGLMMDGVTWLLNSPAESLGYILADNGYDVWIANTRGTVESLHHAWLSSDEPAYWNWSWDELANFELPAIFKYVYKHTGYQKIHYVGHSLSTSTVLASISENNLLNMLRSAVLLGPIAYMDQVSSPLARVAADTFAAEAVYWLGLSRFNPKGEAVSELLHTLCILPWVNCFNKMTVFTGENCCLNSSAVEVFLDHEPQSTSTKNIIHLSQMIRRGTFAKYDYDNSEKNFEHYGEIRPPSYNLANIPNDLPLFISFGGRDKLSDPKDVEHLLNSLKLHQPNKLVVKYINNYAHADFIMAVNARSVLYDPIMVFFQHH